MKKSKTITLHHILLRGLKSAYIQYCSDWEEMQDLSLIDTKQSTKTEIIKYMEKLYNMRASQYAVWLFSSSLLEALINFYLITNLRSEEFKALEKLSPVEKWVIGPRFVDAEYKLEKGINPHQNLLKLFDRRNSIVHHKAFREENGKIKYKGKFPKVQPNEHDLTHSFFELPEEMVIFVIKNKKDSIAFEFAAGSGFDIENFKKYF